MSDETPAPKPKKKKAVSKTAPVEEAPVEKTPKVEKVDYAVLVDKLATRVLELEKHVARLRKVVGVKAKV